MKLKELVSLRLVNQHIAAGGFTTVKEIAGWMGALQAQDYAMSKWALGVRLPGCAENTVNDAISKGEIIRTHVLRPTWHYVSSDDARWMLDLSSSRIKASMSTRNNELELDDKILTRCNSLIHRTLEGGKSMGREELLPALTNSGIRIDNNRASHILGWAELSGIICSGATDGRRHTYALLDERIPASKSLTREEALAKLAMKYFLSHGPATLKDFEWWSGLSAAETRKALESVKQGFINETIGSSVYWFKDQGLKDAGHSAYLLPSFDEFLVSYTDRTASLRASHHKKAVSMNGIFKPVIMYSGVVQGLWKRTIKEDMVLVETDFFEDPGKGLLRSLKKPAAAFGKFLGRKTRLLFNELSVI